LLRDRRPGRSDFAAVSRRERKTETLTERPSDIDENIHLFAEMSLDEVPRIVI
jgi:hypothetical protein